MTNSKNSNKSDKKETKAQKWRHNTQKNSVGMALE